MEIKRKADLKNEKSNSSYFDGNHDLFSDSLWWE